MNQPSEPEGPEQTGKKIGDRPKSEPKGIDGPQESIKVSEGNLEEKEDDDCGGDENGENKSFRQVDSGGIERIYF